jgi:hypothetical protein
VTNFLIYVMALSQFHEVYIGKQLRMTEVILQMNQFLDRYQLINPQSQKRGWGWGKVKNKKNKAIPITGRGGL